MKNELKAQIADQFSQHLNEEELLKLNEMEEVEGGACALGCSTACLFGKMNATPEKNDPSKPVDPPQTPDTATGGDKAVMP